MRVLFNEGLLTTFGDEEDEKVMEHRDELRHGGKCCKIYGEF